jgi:hypothetical protein
MLRAFAASNGGAQGVLLSQAARIAISFVEYPLSTHCGHWQDRANLPPQYAAISSAFNSAGRSQLLKSAIRQRGV